MRLMRLMLAVVLILVAFAAGWLMAKTGVGSAVDPASLTELERQFTERMRGAALVGRFTVAGREDQPARPDRYDISSVEKVGDDRWRFNSRMRYGTVDVTLPITVTMRWANDTPMITLTDFTIPSMGTFTARVLFYGDRYAGTWQHGPAGGHMFGRIEKQGSNGSSGSSGSSGSNP
jgi:uncharacterized membrane protein YgcG